MELRKLKELLNNNLSISLPLILVEENNDFLVNTYVDKLAHNLSREICRISDLNEIKEITSDIFSDNNYLFVYATDELISNLEDFKDIYLVIISKKVPRDPNLDFVKFEKLEDWQIEDYTKYLLPGLSDEEVEWLCKIAKYDIYRINNEASKINIFDKDSQRVIFKEINDDNGYYDLNELTIFDLTNAIIKRDMVTIKKIFSDIDNIDVEGPGIITILLRQFSNLISIQLSANPTPQSTGLSDKQFRAIKYNCGKFSDKKLVDIYKFLNQLDIDLKNGLLDLGNLASDLVTYITARIYE